MEDSIITGIKNLDIEKTGHGTTFFRPFFGAPGLWYIINTKQQLQAIRTFTTIYVAILAAGAILTFLSLLDYPALEPFGNLLLALAMLFYIAGWKILTPRMQKAESPYERYRIPAFGPFVTGAGFIFFLVMTAISLFLLPDHLHDSTFAARVEYLADILWSLILFALPCFALGRSLLKKWA